MYLTVFVEIFTDFYEIQSMVITTSTCYSLNTKPRFPQSRTQPIRVVAMSQSSYKAKAAKHAAAIILSSELPDDKEGNPTSYKKWLKPKACNEVGPSNIGENPQVL